MTDPNSAEARAREVLATVAGQRGYTSYVQYIRDGYSSFDISIGTAVAAMLTFSAEQNTGLRLAAVSEGEGWQDIASAPKDGTPFDAWVPDAFGGRRMIGLSFNGKGQLRQHGLLTAAELPRWPTHWMPQPAAPALPVHPIGGGCRG